MMRWLLYTMVALFAGANACMAQVSTLGTTAMGLPTTSGAIVSSALNGPGPFSATTQPGAPVTTLAPVPLALDPTIAGTSVNCSAPSFQITTLPPVLSSPIATTAAPTATTPTSTTGISTTTTMSSSAALGTIIVSGPSTLASAGSTTGTIVPNAPLGSSPAAGCTSSPGVPSLSATALPLSTPQVAASPPPGTVQSDVTPLADTSLAPSSAAVIPTPNSAACSESVSMDLANPAMMAPANATGAATTPGVTPLGC